MQRPSRYIGGEWNAPEIEPCGVTVALAYPDVYEIGISNLGLAILQEVINGMDGASCERVYSPWIDMEREMRDAGLPLFALETHRPISDYDVFGISIPHELSYTNILNLIDLAGLPLRARDRTDGPLVVGGGCGAANPEPVAEFFDLIFLGEGEKAVCDLVGVLSRGKASGWSRQELLSEAGRLPGAYRPSLYRVTYNDDGTVSGITPAGGAPRKVRKNLVDPDSWLYPRRPVVPFCEAVHDRVNVELFRGCARGCRFCQAGAIYRPVRERDPAAVAELVDELAGRTGFTEVSLCSLSSSDYTMIREVSSRVSGICRERSMALSLPSLRMDGLSVDLVCSLKSVRTGGFTFAPEAGTERMRRVINKPVSEREMAEAILKAAGAGRRRIKLYFMIGLPTETDGDVEEIARLVLRLRDLVRRNGLPAPAFNVSVSTFVPKPHTPFQWAPQDTLESIERKQGILRGGTKVRGVNLSWHDGRMSVVEGLLSRGDRRLADVVERVWERGGRFDSWSEHFDYSLWEQACEGEGVDMGFYLYRDRDEDEAFPWDHIDYGLNREFLFGEYRRALDGETTPDCRGGVCLKCGVCTNLGAETVLAGAWR